MENQEIYNKQQKTHRYTDTDWIDVDLTDDDVLQLADECSKLNEEITRKTDDFKNWQKRKKKEIAGLEDKMAKNFDKIKTRTDCIEDEVEICKDYIQKKVFKHYKGECYSEKEMSDFEYRNMPEQFKDAKTTSEDAEPGFSNTPILTMDTPTKANPRVHADQDKLALDQMQSAREAQDHPQSVNVTQ